MRWEENVIYVEKVDTKREIVDYMIEVITMKKESLIDIEKEVIHLEVDQIINQKEDPM